MSYCVTCGDRLAKPAGHSPEVCLDSLRSKLEIAKEALQTIQDETECVVARELATDALEGILSNPR